MRKILKRLGIVLAILLLLCVTYTVSSKWIIKHFIISGNYDMAVLIYNNQIYRGLWNDECEQLFNEQINNINTDFFVDDDLSEENFLNDYDNKYNNTIDKLVVLSSIKNQYISQLAMDLRELVDKEYKGRIKLIEAETEYQKEKYVECLKIITDISDDFSLTDSVDELKNDCISEVLYSISNPNSVEEYEKYISLSDECIAICSDKQLVDRKKELENELVDFKNVVGYIEDAESYIDKGDFINAVKVLNNPTKDYPNEKHLSLALEDCQSYLIFYVGESVNKYLENKEYKEALSLIEEAQNVYSCEDLDTLHDHVKTISSPWYRFKTTVVDKTKSIIDYFKKDVTNVKQEGGVAYIYRSGEKIILGDYSKKDVSLLSVTGSGLLSIIGVDVPLDIRDLSYDVQHIGEEDDWLVWLAVDTVALLPVVGTVKYIKYAKKTGKIADSVSDVSKIADDVSDAAKNVDNVSDASKVADNVSDAAKGVDVISDVARVTERIDEIKDVKLGKIADKP
ncbi:MAG: hypothetical protein Q4D51_11740, partial [Eubacteriales bacterium]|nr:hypothetical protein [Eubacteriales bacterium]